MLRFLMSFVLLAPATAAQRPSFLPLMPPFAERVADFWAWFGEQEQDLAELAGPPAFSSYRTRGALQEKLQQTLGDVEFGVHREGQIPSLWLRGALDRRVLAQYWANSAPNNLGWMLYVSQPASPSQDPLLAGGISHATAAFQCRLTIEEGRIAVDAYHPAFERAHIDRAQSVLRRLLFRALGEERVQHALGPSRVHLERFSKADAPIVSAADLKAEICKLCQTHSIGSKPEGSPALHRADPRLDSRMQIRRDLGAQDVWISARRASNTPKFESRVADQLRRWNAGIVLGDIGTDETIKLHCLILSPLDVQHAEALAGLSMNDSVQWTERRGDEWHTETIRAASAIPLLQPAAARKLRETFDAAIGRAPKKSPGGAIAVVDLGSGSTWYHTSGYANISTRERVSLRTRFPWDSLTRHATWRTFEILKRSGRLDPSRPIDELVPDFLLRNEAGEPIDPQPSLNAFWNCKIQVAPLRIDAGRDFMYAWPLDRVCDDHIFVADLGHGRQDIPRLALFQLAAEHATGLPWAQITQEAVWAPAGIDDLVFDNGAQRPAHRASRCYTISTDSSKFVESKDRKSPVQALDGTWGDIRSLAKFARDRLALATQQGGIACIKNHAEQWPSTSVSHWSGHDLLATSGSRHGSAHISISPAHGIAWAIACNGSSLWIDREITEIVLPRRVTPREAPDEDGPWRSAVGIGGPNPEVNRIVGRYRGTISVADRFLDVVMIADSTTVQSLRIQGSETLHSDPSGRYTTVESDPPKLSIRAALCPLPIPQSKEFSMDLRLHKPGMIVGRISVGGTFGRVNLPIQLHKED